MFSLKPKLAMDHEMMKKRKKSRLRSANWTVSQTSLLLKLLKKKQQELGEENIDGEVWEQITVALNKKSRPPRKAEQVKMRLKTIKTEFNDYKICVEKPGWGWDSRRKLPIAPSGKCWDEAIEVNSPQVRLLLCNYTIIFCLFANTLYFLIDCILLFFWRYIY